jgi:ABC-type multidrug transport system fused ATPase/permease subunit
MDERDENKAAVHRVFIFLVGLLGVGIVLFGAYNAVLTYLYLKWGLWNNNYFAFTIGIYSVISVIGLITIWCAFKLRHKLLPDEIDIERNLEKSEKIADIREAREKKALEKQHEIDAKNREKRAILAQERAAKYQENLRKQAEIEKKNAERAKKPEYTNFVAKNYSDKMELISTSKMYLWYYLRIVAGLVLMVGTVVFGVKYTSYADTHAGSTYSGMFYFMLFLMVVFFWTGLFMFFGAIGTLARLKTSYIVSYQDRLYVFRLKWIRIEEAASIEGVLAHSVFGKLINSIAIYAAIGEYSNKFRQVIDSEDINDKVMGMMGGYEFDSLVELLPINSKAMPVSVRKLYYKSYVKAVG